MLEYKSFDFKVSNVEELEDGEWLIEGWASTWTKDNGNDRVMFGAFRESYEERFVKQKKLNGKSKIKVLWQHDPSDIIGQLIEAREEDKGLYVKIKLINHPLFINAAKAYILAKLGEIDSFSIGYKTLAKRKVFEDGVEITELIKVKWYEVSIVTFPMNELAEFTSVKDEDEEMNEKVIELLTSLDLKLSEVLTQTAPKEEADEVKTEETQINISESKVQLEPSAIKLDVTDLAEVFNAFKAQLLEEVKSMVTELFTVPTVPLPEVIVTVNGEEVKSEEVLEEKAKMHCKDCGHDMQCPQCSAGMKSDDSAIIEEVVEEKSENISDPEIKEEDILDLLLNREFKF